MTTQPKKTRSRKAKAPKPTPAQTAKAGLKRPRAGASKTSTTAQQGQVEIVANELNWLRGAMIVLAYQKHDPTGQTKPVTDPDWWGTKRGVYMVRLAKARQAAVGIHRDLNSSFEHSVRIETDVRILIDDLLSKWVPMLEPGRWDIEKSRQVRALYERVEECAKLLRNASSQAVGGSVARPTETDAPTIIRAAVAEQRYEVNAQTIGEAVRDGSLTDYRPAGHAKNAPHQVDERKVANRWPKRPAPK